MAQLANNPVVLLAIFNSMLVVGCSQSAVRGHTAASAPSLKGEGQAHIRGVSDPNAPFTLVDRTRAETSGSAVTAGEIAEVCLTANLQVYESGASMNGNNRTVRLAVKNRGTASCRLTGSPIISLRDESGAPIASVLVKQSGTSSVAGVIAAPVEETSRAASPAVNLQLAPSSEATFEIRWTSGDDCPLISRVIISLPQTASTSPLAPRAEVSGEFTVNHPLNVCGGQVLVSDLATSTSI